jgi:hypothetical protein
MRIPRSAGGVLAFAVILGCFLPFTATAQTADSATVAPTDTLLAPPPGVTQATATPVVTTTPAPPPAAPREDAGMFSQGRRRVTGTVGWGSSLGSDYLLVGVGLGYFIRNGLDVGVDFEGWFLGDPTMYKISPRADLVMWRSPRLKPYVGAFYRWNFISDFEDENSLGGRAGAFYRGTRGGMAGAGVVYERFLSDRFEDRDVIYPEVFIAVSF